MLYVAKNKKHCPNWKALTPLMEVKDWIHLKTIPVISCCQVQLCCLVSYTMNHSIHPSFHGLSAHRCPMSPHRVSATGTEHHACQSTGPRTTTAACSSAYETTRLRHSECAFLAEEARGAETAGFRPGYSCSVLD